MSPTGCSTAADSPKNSPVKIPAARPTRIRTDKLRSRQTRKSALKVYLIPSSAYCCPAGEQCASTACFIGYDKSEQESGKTQRITRLSITRASREVKRILSTVSLYRHLVLTGSLLLGMLLAGCAGTAGETSLPSGLGNDIRTQTKHGVTVATTVLSDAQAREVYGVDLSRVGLQAVWLRLENDSDHSHWLLVAGLDPDYFAPGEAAALFFAGLSNAEEERLDSHFRQLAMPLKSGGGTVTEGYILTPRNEGGRYVAVTLAGENHAVQFDFVVRLPDGEFDFESLDPEQIYAEVERPDLSLDELREQLRQQPCCTHNESGELEGDPINLVLLGNFSDIFAALSRGGWSFTHRISLDTVRRLIGAGISGAAYPVAPVSPLYLYGRSQELSLQRARNTIVQRNHLRLWLAPFRYAGRSVWMGQISRDIGIKATFLSSKLVTHVIDPNVDEAREHLLQSLMVSGVVQRFGFVGGAPESTPSSPRYNLTHDPYYSDGLRLVAQISGHTTTSLDEMDFLGWRDSPDPQRAARPVDCPARPGELCGTLLPPSARPAVENSPPPDPR